MNKVGSPPEMGERTYEKAKVKKPPDGYDLDQEELYLLREMADLCLRIRTRGRFFRNQTISNLDIFLHTAINDVYAERKLLTGSPHQRVENEGNTVLLSDYKFFCDRIRGAWNIARRMGVHSKEFREAHQKSQQEFDEEGNPILNEFELDRLSSDEESVSDNTSMDAESVEIERLKAGPKGPQPGSLKRIFNALNDWDSERQPFPKKDHPLGKAFGNIDDVDESILAHRQSNSKNYLTIYSMKGWRNPRPTLVDPSSFLPIFGPFRSFLTKKAWTKLHKYSGFEAPNDYHNYVVAARQRFQAPNWKISFPIADGNLYLTWSEDCSINPGRIGYAIEHWSDLDLLILYDLSKAADCVRCLRMVIDNMLKEDDTAFLDEYSIAKRTYVGLDRWSGPNPFIQIVYGISFPKQFWEDLDRITDILGDTGYSLHSESDSE
jgi:hypothetical protein